MHQPKDIEGWVENMCMCALPLDMSLCLTSPNCMQLFYIIKLIMFPLRLAL